MKKFVPIFLLLLLMAFLAACGAEAPAPAEPAEPNMPADPQPSAPLSFADIQHDLQRNCGRCHGTSGFINNDRAFFEQRAAARILKDSMPPRVTPEFTTFAAAKADILEFIRRNQ